MGQVEGNSSSFEVSEFYEEIVDFARGKYSGNFLEDQHAEQEDEDVKGEEDEDEHDPATCIDAVAQSLPWYIACCQQRGCKHTCGLGVVSCNQCERYYHLVCVGLLDPEISESEVQRPWL